MEVMSLHAVLKEGEETLFTRPLPPARAERLKIIKDGCNKVLVDLQSLVQKYESLNTQSKRTWDRLRWGSEDIADIRSRLISNITLLTSFISTSQASVETKLDKFIDEFRQGKKEGSVISLQTVDSLSADDRAVWRTIRKELEEIGISVAAFDANRDFIFDWFVRAVETGAFEEQGEQSVDEENDEESSESAPDAEAKVPTHNPKTLENQVSVSIRTPPKEKSRVPRFAVLLAGISLPGRRLIKAVESGNVSKALDILKDEASSHLLGSKTLDRALWSATRHVGESELYTLVADLIAKGGNVNYRSNALHERTPLWNSVASGSYTIVQLLIEKGADVNYEGPYAINGHTAIDFAPRASLTKNPAILRLLLSSGVNVNARYNEVSYERSNISLLHEATSIGAVAAIQTLLEFGAEIDAQSNYGTVLMFALVICREDVVKLLLAKGADPNLRALSGVGYPLPEETGYKSPLEAAIYVRDASKVKLLFEYGAVPDFSTVEFMDRVLPLGWEWAEDEIRRRLRG